MKITKEYLDGLKEQCLKQIDEINNTKPVNSTDRKNQKMVHFGLSGQVMLLDSLIYRLEEADA